MQCNMQWQAGRQATFPHVYGRPVDLQPLVVVVGGGAFLIAADANPTAGSCAACE